MRNLFFDFRELRNEGDIKAAKKKLRNYILVEEDMLSSNIDNLGNNVFSSFKRLILETGTKIMINTFFAHLKSRFTK